MGIQYAKFASSHKNVLRRNFGDNNLELTKIHLHIAFTNHGQTRWTLKALSNITFIPGNLEGTNNDPSGTTPQEGPDQFAWYIWYCIFQNLFSWLFHYTHEENNIRDNRVYNIKNAFLFMHARVYHKKRAIS